jgi:hypothetical protein
MERLAERGWEFFMELASGNVLAGLLKRITKGAEMLSVGNGESVRACAGRICARD